MSMVVTMDDIKVLAYQFYLRWEGGATYTDHPQDPGGPTKFGVALNYNRDAIPDKNGDGRIDAEDVRRLTEADARAIWTKSYWALGRCDAFPPALAFMMADMTVNPGPGAAPKCLQRAINRAADGAFSVAVDGKVGPATLAAIGRLDQVRLLCEVAAQRAWYYGTRSTFDTFGEGWSRRTTACLYEALRLAGAVL